MWARAGALAIEQGCQLTTWPPGPNFGRATYVARPRHPKKEIEEAIRHAVSSGWRVEIGGSHAWGRLYCPYDDADCRCGEFCIISIWSTPRNPGNYARMLRRVVKNCTARKRLANPSGREADSE